MLRRGQHRFCVDQNETWTTDKNMSRDIRVKAGATLTLRNMTLNMPKDGLIVIKLQTFHRRQHPS